MKLKKINAVLSILSAIMLFIHMIFYVVAYLHMFYHPVVFLVFGCIVLIPLLTHAVLSGILFFCFHDSKTIQYPKRNIRTLFQRITAVGIAVLLPIHAIEFELLQKNIGNLLYPIVETIRILFYACILFHAALSIGNAFVTLGYLQDIKKKKILDTILLVAAFVIFTGMSIYITVMHQLLFSLQ